MLGWRCWVLGLLSAMAATGAQAQIKDLAVIADNGRLLATGGVTQVEGAGGGGLVPWALISGYGSSDSVGVTLSTMRIYLHDYTLQTEGAALGLFNRVELSYAHHVLSLDNDNLRAGGLARGRDLGQDIAGLKWRVLGDAVYDQDNFWPQVALGAFYKRADDAQVIQAVGARHRDGVEFYLAATKLLAGSSLIVNATLRLTKANQLGLFGFGGPGGDDLTPRLEASLAYLITKRWILGAEWRQRPNNLRLFNATLPIARERDAYSAFSAYFLSKNASVTLAYVDLGRIGDVSLAPLGQMRSLQPANQNGVYTALQIAF